MPSGSVSAPIMVDVRDSGSYYNPDVGSSKRGTATVTGILIFSSGDGSIGAAMANGGITKIHHIDYEYSNILGIVAKKTTVVYGE